jgi:hypothetical protein
MEVLQGCGDLRAVTTEIAFWDVTDKKSTNVSEEYTATIFMDERISTNIPPSASLYFLTGSLFNLEDRKIL